jgi:hypothetical protein
LHAFDTRGRVLEGSILALNSPTENQGNGAVAQEREKGVG